MLSRVTKGIPFKERKMFIDKLEYYLNPNELQSLWKINIKKDLMSIMSDHFPQSDVESHEDCVGYVECPCCCVSVGSSVITGTTIAAHLSEI